MPRQRLAAGADPAPPRPRRPVRVRLPGAAHGRHQAARRPGRARGRLHRSARLVRGVPARRRLGRARPDLGPVRRRGPHPAALPRPRPASAAPDHRRHRAVRGRRSSSPTRSPASTRTPGSRCPTPTTSGTRIDALGPSRSTRASSAGDVRLTQGGEPTFVSIDDMDAEEWTIGADGDDKRARAWELTRRLADAFAPGALLHPARASGTRASRCPAGSSASTGAPTASRCGRRRDLFADPFAPGTVDGRPGRGAGPGPRRSPRRARRRACTPPTRIPLVRCSTRPAPRPANRPTSTSTPRTQPGDRRGQSDGGRRPRRRRRRADGLGHAAAPPAHRAGRLGHHASGCCAAAGSCCCPATRRRACGCRSTRSPGPRPSRSRSDRRSSREGRCRPHEPAIATRTRRSTSRRTRTTPRPRPPRRALGLASRHARHGRAGDDAPPTALGVELRDGRVHVFLPPLTHLEDAVELLAVVEAEVVAAGRARRDRGLPAAARPPAPHPRRHPRPRRHRGQPAAGVVVGGAGRHHRGPLRGGPRGAARHREVRARRHPLGLGRRQPRHPRRRHAGRQPVPAPARPAAQHGHLLAAPPVAVVPVLRPLRRARRARPPGSTRPVTTRSTSSRSPSARWTASATTSPPWLVDRLFRHLLVDLTGNTHRAEFCIDKLFTPEGERGRLGLVELRGFEMPPHPRMALVQALLVRALVARFWDDPYEARLVRWGTELHDRFLLPHEVATDIADVVDDLVAHDIPFELVVARPVPRVPLPAPRHRRGPGRPPRAARRHRAVARARRGGRRSRPPRATSTRRSSASRCASRASRPAATWSPATVGSCRCGPRPPPAPRSPVCATGPGSRRRALHPTIGVHSPLVFDVVDLAAGRSLGGCTYRVSHPGGRNYDRFPVNANEADARRTARFGIVGHTPGSVDVALVEAELARIDGYPRTLDLRRPATLAPAAPLAPRALTTSSRPAAMTLPPTTELPVGYRPPDGRVRRARRRRRTSAATGPRWPARSTGLGPTSWHERAPARPGACSPTTASPTTTSPAATTERRLVGARPGARRGVRPTSGPASRPASPSGPSCSTSSSPTCTGPGGCWPTGILPPEVVYGHPGFLRQCDQIRLPGDHQLFHAAFDLGPRRRRHRGWCCRTAPRRRRAWATPSRTGSWCPACCPDLYRDAEVVRLAPFFRELRASLQRVAPPAADEPRIVVLTPGPVERDRLRARRRSPPTSAIPLVQGSDLRVRDGRVWVRTARSARAGPRDPASGRRRRTAIRSSCAPTPRSARPGLLEACRVGNVSVVNTLRQRRAREPRAARRSCPSSSEALLGQPLRLPSAPARGGAATRTRCGRCSTASHELVLKSVVGHRSAPRWSGSGLIVGRAGRPAGPHRGPSPTRGSGRSRSPLGLGADASSTAGSSRAGRWSAASSWPASSGYAVMPGGLTRVGQQPAATGSSATRAGRGARTRGCWPASPSASPASGCSRTDTVDADRARDLDVAAGRREPVLAEPLRRAGRGSRAPAAGRVRPSHRVRRRAPTRPATPASAVLLAALTHTTGTFPGFVGEGAARAARRARRPSSAPCSSTPTAPGSVAHSVRRLLDAAAQVRDQLSNDTWLVIGHLERDLAVLDRNLPVAAVTGGVRSGHGRHARPRRAVGRVDGPRRRLAVHGGGPPPRAGPAAVRRCCRPR